MAIIKVIKSWAGRNFTTRRHLYVLLIP